MKNHGKIIITKTVDNFSGYELECNLVELMVTFQRYIDRYGPSVYLDYGQHTSYNDSYSFNVKIKREETDEEYEKRVGLEYERANNIEQQEREQLAALLKKYGEPK